MTGRSLPLSLDSSPAPTGPGLRARLRLACLLGPLVSLIASGCLIAAVALAGRTLDPMVLMLGMAFAALLGMAAGLAAGHWIARGVSAGLRRIEEGVGAGNLPEAPIDAPDWGEIGAVAASARRLIDAQRTLRRSAVELHNLRATLSRSGESVERWIATEQWQTLAPVAVGLAPLAEILDRGFARWAEVRAQNLEAARVVRADLARVIEESRASADAAEHGYVEATALLTTVREIARLTTELQQAAEAPEAPAVESPEIQEWRAEAAGALEELIQVSGESVEDLGSGLLTVREISSQVQVLCNRATLIALNVVVAVQAPETTGEGTTAELKELAREVRAATERVTELSRDVEAAVESANGRMRGVRARVHERLERIERLAEAPVAEAPRAEVHAPRVDRLREMVQDAARKGERLCESQERVSSAVQRFARRLEEQARDVDGLVVRLSPMGASAAEGREASRAAGTEDKESRQLRVVEGQERPRETGEPPLGGQSRE